MRGININDFYTSININQRTQYCHANQNTKEWERWNLIPIFPIEATTLWLIFLLIIVSITNPNKLLLFCFYIKWIFYLIIQLFLVGSIFILMYKLLLLTTRCTYRKKSSYLLEYVALNKRGGELFIRDFRKLWRYNEIQCWITEKRIKETKTQNCFKMISEKQSVVSSKQSVVYTS